MRQGEQIGEALFERLVAGDLAAMSRITRPNRMRRNFNARRARLNWWA
jgi:hypothetical protein